MENANQMGLEARIRMLVGALSLFTLPDTEGRRLSLPESAGMERRWYLPARGSAGSAGEGGDQGLPGLVTGSIDLALPGFLDDPGDQAPPAMGPDFSDQAPPGLVADFSDADGVIDLSLTDNPLAGTGSDQPTIPLQITITLSPQGEHAYVWIESDRYGNANRQFGLAAEDDLARLAEFVKLFGYLIERLVVPLQATTHVP